MYIILSYANIWIKTNTMQYKVLYFNIYLTVTETRKTRIFVVF